MALISQWFYTTPADLQDKGIVLRLKKVDIQML
jgi:hypothetical protein